MAAATEVPPIQASPAAWLGPEMAAQPECWTWALAAGEVAEVEAAADAFLARGGGAAVLDADAFQLPTLGPRLIALRRELIEGRGFELVQGLELHKWPREKAAAAFLGLGAHIGSARSQNALGHLLGHV